MNDGRNYRARIIITIPEDGNVEIAAEGCGAVEMLGCAALLERAANTMLDAAERANRLAQPDLVIPKGALT